MGVIFDFARTRHKEKLVRPGYYREEVYDSLMLDPKDSSIRYLPCPCGPCDKVEEPRRTGKARGEEDEPRIEPREPQQTDEPRNRTNAPRTGGTTTPNPRPKSSFPGVKTPPPPPAPTPKH